MGFGKEKLLFRELGMAKKQTVETLINEEALLIAKYLRNEKQTWSPNTFSL